MRPLHAAVKAKAPITVIASGSPFPTALRALDLRPKTFINRHFLIVSSLGGRAIITVELHDRSNNLVKILSGAKNAAYHNVLNSDGSGTFLIHRADPDVATYGIIDPARGIEGYIVHLLRKGRLETTFTDRFQFVVESVVVAVGQQEDAGAWYHVSGRGTLCLLEDRMCFPPGYDGVTTSTIKSQWQIYTGQPAGAIMAGELDRSASRFTIPLTHSLDTRATYASVVAADSPLHWYRLGEASGTVAVDQQGAGGNGTYVNAPTLGVAGALYVDTDTAVTFAAASSQKVTFTPGISGNQTWSAEAWIKFAANPANTQVFLSFGAVSGHEVSLMVDPVGRIQIGLGTGPNGGIGSVVSTAIWHHVVATYDATTVRVYVDGQPYGTTLTPGVLNVTNAAGRIGSQFSDLLFFSGQVDEAAVYSTALSATRVFAHYATGTSYTKATSQTTIPQTVKLRFDNLRLLHDGLAAAGPMEAQMVGTDYQPFDAIGTDKSATVTIRMAPQDSLLGVTFERDARPVKNFVVAQGTGEGLATLLGVASDATSIANLRRREGFQEARSVDTQSQLNLTAAGAITQYKAVDQRITTRFFDSTHTQIYCDFGLGDTINLAVIPLNFGPTKYRVIGISVADVDAEHEECALDLNDMRSEYLVKLLKGTVNPTVASLNVLSRMPQGSVFNDVLAYPDNCTSAFPFHFIIFIPSNVILLLYAKLSFFLQAFRSYNDFSVTGTSAGSSHNHNIGSHNHGLAIAAGPTGVNLMASSTAAVNNNSPSSWTDTGSIQNANLASSGSEASHTHTISASNTAGIFESTVANNVTVKINGVDRTVALGGGAGFTADQTEIEISQYLTIGIKNTIDLTPSGLGRILGHLRLTTYIQSV